MHILLRLLLIFVSIAVLFWALKKIRSSQVQISSTVFWILSMIVLVIISIFPGIVIFFSDLIGIESPANFVFLCIIFLLLLKVFILSLKLSKMQYQIQKLAQIIALGNSREVSDKSTWDGKE